MRRSSPAPRSFVLAALGRSTLTPATPARPGHQRRAGSIPPTSERTVMPLTTGPRTDKAPGGCRGPGAVAGSRCRDLGVAGGVVPPEGGRVTVAAGGLGAQLAQDGVGAGTGQPRRCLDDRAGHGPVRSLAGEQGADDLARLARLRVLRLVLLDVERDRAV